MRTLPSEQDIIKILPQIGVFPQVNDRSSLMPMVIYKEMHSTHTCTVRTDSKFVKHRMLCFPGKSPGV
jgi:hypothetical protein